jgi:hypothetical protein
MGRGGDRVGNWVKLDDGSSAFSVSLDEVGLLKGFEPGAKGPGPAVKK